jgi:hypothetical protein
VGGRREIRRRERRRIEGRGVCIWMGRGSVQNVERPAGCGREKWRQAEQQQPQKGTTSKCVCPSESNIALACLYALF